MVKEFVILKKNKYKLCIAFIRGIGFCKILEPHVSLWKMVALTSSFLDHI